MARSVLAVAAGAMLAFPLIAADNPMEDRAADVPARVETGLFHAPARLAAADGVIDHGASLGHCGPWIEDVDGDSAKDLVIGDFSGGFLLYRNLGTNRAPKYAKGVKMRAGGVDAQVPIY